MAITEKRSRADLFWLSNRFAVAIDVENTAPDATAPPFARLVIVADDADELPVPAEMSAKACLDLAQGLMAAATLIDPMFVARFIETSKVEAAMTRQLVDLSPAGPTH